MPDKRSKKYLAWYDRVMRHWADGEFVDEKHNDRVTVLAKNRHGCTMVVANYKWKENEGFIWEFPDLNFEGYDAPHSLGRVPSAF